MAHSHRITDDNYLKEETFDTVRIEVLDDIVNHENVEKIDFIKLDVEGFEKNVLEGCSNLIEKYNPIFYIEFNSWCLIAFKNENPRDFLNFLCQRFTHIYWIKNENLFRLDSETKLMEFLHENLTQNGCVDNLVCLNGNIELRKKSKIWFNANDLATQIGARGSFLFAP